MKTILLNGSPKSNGNTFATLKIMEKILNEKGIETEIITIGNKNISGCRACNMCAKNQDKKCIISNDIVNEVIEKIDNADGLILSSPVYFAGVNGTMKSLLDRVFYVSAVNGSIFRHKVGASVVAVRRSGGLPTFNELNHYLFYSEMALASSNYWNVIHGHRPNEIPSDLEGNQIIELLAENFSWLVEVINKSEVPTPNNKNKILTNFVR